MMQVNVKTHWMRFESAFPMLNRQSIPSEYSIAGAIRIEPPLTTAFLLRRAVVLRGVIVALWLCMAGCSQENGTFSSFSWPTLDRRDVTVTEPELAQPHPPIHEPLEVGIVGRAFEWHIRYPGADGVLGTADDLIARRHPHLPANKAVCFKLTSADYVYSVSLPHFRLKDIAIPDQTYSLNVGPTAAGTYELKGDQFCGFSHPNLSGELIVEPQAAFEAWLKTLEPAR